ncbi:hypothetical protein D9M68_876610 [compost metagenome]
MRLVIASAISTIFEWRAQATKRRNQGSMLGSALGRSARGPFWSSSQEGIFFRMPGLDSGMTSLTAIWPQLHLAVLSPGAAGSTRVT